MDGNVIATGVLRTRARCYCVWVITIALTGGALADYYSGGTGEPNDPFQIATAEDLNDIGNHEDHLGKHFILVADVNLAAYTETEFNIIGGPWSNDFTGVFDGNNHTISNFTYTAADANFVGLIVSIDRRGEVRNVVMENVNVSGNEIVGALTGLNFGTISQCRGGGSIRGNRMTGGLAGMNYGTLWDCYIDGIVHGLEDHVGGLVGDNHGAIRDCYATGTVDGNDYVGGLVGDNYGAIQDCYTAGTVDGNFAVGGLVGNNYGTMISDCYAVGNVSGNEIIGGLVGRNSDPISRCYTGGSVDGNSTVGGLVGWNIKAPISDCYAMASVFGNRHIGGLIGNNGTGTIEYCYAAGKVSGHFHTGGLVGCGSSAPAVTASFWDTETCELEASDGGIGKTTAEMKDPNTFSNIGWDFIEIWDIGEHQTYPYLRKRSPGDINHDEFVDFSDLAYLGRHWLKGDG